MAAPKRKVSKSKCLIKRVFKFDFLKQNFVKHSTFEFFHNNLKKSDKFNLSGFNKTNLSKKNDFYFNNRLTREVFKKNVNLSSIFSLKELSLMKLEYKNTIKVE